MRKIRSSSDGRRHVFHCPGCDHPHVFGEGWSFNGDPERPSFTPSLFCSWTEGEAKTLKICHSVVTLGRIAYTSDSTHALAGKTIDLPDWDPLHPNFWMG